METRTIAVDFGRSDIYEKIDAGLAGLEIGVLGKDCIPLAFIFNNMHTLSTDNVHTLSTDNVHALSTDNVHALSTDNVHTLCTDNMYTLSTDKALSVKLLQFTFVLDIPLA